MRPWRRVSPPKRLPRQLDLSLMCKPETSAYIGVEPGSPAPANLAFRATVCTTSSVDNLSVAPFTAGAGTYIDG